MSALAELRDSARSSLASRGAPTARDEDWRYVALRGYAAFAPDAPTPPPAPTLADAHLLVRDGKPRDGAKPPGPWQISFDADSDSTVRWQQALAEADLGETIGLAHLVGVIRLTLRGTAPAPLRILDQVSGGEHGWRLVVDLAPGAVGDLVIVHQHAGKARAGLGVEVTAGAGAVLRVDELELGEPGHVHIVRHLRTGRDARISWAGASAGGELSRHCTFAHLDGQGSAIELAGVSSLRGKRQHHQLVRVYHHAGNATSRQDFRCVADDETTASFDGVIHVDVGADGTDAFQNSGNLQLGPRARVAARPQLDILADEVVASHGATVGRPDADEVRYLMSRGIGRRAAAGLIVGGFLDVGLAHLADPEARELGRRLLREEPTGA